MADVVYSNVRELMRELNSIEPALKKGLVKDLKQLAKPVQSSIVQSIPNQSPLRGMNTGRGRLSYYNSTNYKGRRVLPKSVTVRFRAGRSSRAAVTSLLSVVVNSPAVAMLDMARYYKTPQGAAMVRRIGGHASRYVWPAANKALPEVQRQAKIALEKAANSLNRKLR